MNDTYSFHYCLAESGHQDEERGVHALLLVIIYVSDECIILRIRSAAAWFLHICTVHVSYLLVEFFAWIGRVSNCMSVSCAHLVCFTISDSKRYWNHTGYHTVGALCLLQKRIERGSQAAIASHTYMSMTFTLFLLACGYTCTTTLQLFTSDVLAAAYFVVLLQFSLKCRQILGGSGTFDLWAESSSSVLSPTIHHVDLFSPESQH